MHRKWAVVRFASSHIAAAADFVSLSVKGPPGVSMKFSMHPIVTKGTEPQETSHLNSVVGTSARDTEGRQGGGLEWDKQAPAGAEDAGNGEEEEWQLVVEAAFIECRNMLAYANLSAAGGPCQVCMPVCDGGAGGGGGDALVCTSSVFQGYQDRRVLHFGVDIGERAASCCWAIVSRRDYVMVPAKRVEDVTFLGNARYYFGC